MKKLSGGVYYLICERVGLDLVFELLDPDSTGVDSFLAPLEELSPFGPWIS